MTDFSDAHHIAAVGDNVYVTWTDDFPGNDETFFTASYNNGLSFSNPVNLSNNTKSSINPQIAAVDDNVYIIWLDLRTDSEIFFTASYNNGQIFSNPINLSNSSGGSSQQIAAVDDNVYVTWREVDINSAKGEIFFVAGDELNNIPINLSNNGGSSNSPLIAAN